MLSIDVAKKLNIVHINTKGSPGHPEFEAKKYAAGATQNPKSILTPFNKGKIFLSCETRCSSSTIDPEGGYTKLLKQQILQEYDDVFESQPPMKSEKFKIVLRDDAIPFCISKARQIPVAFQQALKNELDELLAEGIITPVTEATEWVNPAVPKLGAAAPWCAARTCESCCIYSFSDKNCNVKVVSSFLQFYSVW